LNRLDYSELAAWSGFVAGALWPLYGLFCHFYLGLPERMVPRVFLGAAFVAMALMAHFNRFGIMARWLWVLCGALGMVWLPWMLNQDSAHSAYWIASLSFFGSVLGMSIRSWDLPIAALLGTIFICFTKNSLTQPSDLGLIPVPLIAAWIGAIMMMTLRNARRRIERQNRQILHQNERLRTLDRAKNEFTASVAHDLRTPLTVALSLADDLSREELSPVAKTRLDSLSMALDQMRRQSEDLLDLERFQLGVARLDPLEVDVHSWVRKFEHGLTSLARTRGISFQIVHAARNLRARFDTVRMEAVLHNLVTNAFKFTPEGGHVEIHIRREAARTLLISVIDDGEGIPASALPTIFDRFQQVDRGPGTYTVGAGIGLALVHEIVEAHGGAIRVESTPTLGSLFEVRLPGALLEDEPETTRVSLPVAPAANKQAPVAEKPPGHGSLLVLVIEDDNLLRHVLRDILAGIARCATARDGRDGLRLAHELHPDLIITDVAMPHMDGLELLAALRQDPSFATTPVVLLSGDVVSLKERIAPDPLVSIQSKPFDRLELIEAVLSLTTTSI